MKAQTSIQSARRAKGLSQKQAAALVHIDQGQWSRIERGIQQPRFDVVFRICEALDLSEADVLAPFRGEARAA